MSFYIIIKTLYLVLVRDLSAAISNYISNDSFLFPSVNFLLWKLNQPFACYSVPYCVL